MNYQNVQKKFLIHRHFKQTNKQMNKQQKDSLMSVARAFSVEKASDVKVNMT